MKKKALYTLLSLLIVLALAVPVWSTVVRADTPTEISNWDELDAIRNNLSGSYLLVNDLDSTTDGYAELAGEDADDEKGWQPIGDSDSPFAGIFDGQNYEIRDLYVNRPDEDYVGLFGHVGPAGAIENVGVVDANVTGKWFVGGLAGRKWGPVSNSYATGSVAGTEYVGGLVGNNSNGDVSNSYSKAGVTGDDYVGGLLGWTSDVTTVADSYATGSVAGDYYVGGLVGENAGTVTGSYATGSVSAAVHRAGGLVGVNYLGTVINCYATGSVSGSSMVGGLVGDNYQGLVSYSYSTGSVSGGSLVGGLVGDNYEGNVSNSFWDTETSGTDYSDGGVGRTTAQMKSFGTFNGAGWDIAAVLFGNISDTHIWSIVEGQTYPFLNWESPGQIRDWYDLHTVRNNLSGHYFLMNDLDSDTAGYFDFAGEDANGGEGWQPIGTHTPWAPFNGTFNGQGHEIGDMVIDRPAENEVGLFGFVGSAGTVGDVGLARANVAGNNMVGALAGRCSGTVSNSHSDGSVTGNDVTGGLVGINFGSVINSHSSANVAGNNRVGALVGENGSAGTVSTSHSAGSVNGVELYVGGLVGLNWGTVSNSFSSASVTGNERVGGLVGDNQGTVSDSHSSGSVAGDNTVGGLVAWNSGSGTIFLSYAAGSVSGSFNVGGLVGYNGATGTVSNSYATGTVTRSSGENERIGGFVGWNWQGQIINCYSTGSVHYEGVDDPTDKGFAGNVDKGGDYEITDCFWDEETSGQSSSACGDATGEETAAMKNLATFTGADWDITAVDFGVTNPTHIWNIVDGQTYPFLSWQDPVDEEAPGALIEGQTREVNCDILDGVTVTASLNGDEVHATSDGEYSLLVPVTGLYQVVASKDGFRPQTRSIDIEDLEEEYTLHFSGDHGLVPNAPDVFYVLQVVNVWLYPPDEECELSVFKVLEVVNAWLYPVLED